MQLHDLASFYRGFLLDGIVPFWMRHGADHEFGGVLSCMNEDGTPVNTNKYIWSQARFLWVLSALYRRLEARAEWLEAARKTAQFLIHHGRDPQGRWLYCVSREGAPIEGPTSIFADCFAVYGFTEYHRASGDTAALDLAVRIHRNILARIAAGDMPTAPYAYPPDVRIHSISMMLTEITNRLAEATGDPEHEAVAERHARRIVDKFLRPEKGALVEILSPSYETIPGPAGTYVVPGHAIESMWFVIEWARRRGHQDVIRRAVQAIRQHLELGWDPEFGGLFLAIDLEGHPPYFPNAEKKIWWPHTEALYALLLAHGLTGEPWCLDWYWRIHHYSFEHFHMPEVGEWRQRLNREGKPIQDLIALPVKDPFHLPRAVLLILELLGAKSTPQS
ncbi:MAG: AGE family epimerase/isomerase [Bryobacterales bacterium]|nr:AGE family epimerase/isomerase [Bryobacterales bacterium]